MAENNQNKINTLPFEQLKNSVDLLTILKLFEEKISFNTLNCIRVGIVDEYNPDTRIAKILIANKMLIGQNADGSQVTQNYAPIYAKVWFFGWGDVGDVCDDQRSRDQNAV